MGVCPSTLTPLTSMTSSPTDIRPDRSAAPPCITLAINMRPVSSSALMVAPYNKRKIVSKLKVTEILLRWLRKLSSINTNWHEAGQIYPHCNFWIGYCWLIFYQKFTNIFRGEN